MLDFSKITHNLNGSFSIHSLDIFSIKYYDDIQFLVEEAIEVLPNIKINIYFNIEQNFKDLIYTNNIFNKLMHLSNITNVSLYQTKSTDFVIILNKNLNNTFSLNNFSKSTTINSNIFNCKPFNLDLLAKVYSMYVSQKIELYDYEFKVYFNNNNNITLNPANIPQFSSLEHAYTSAVNIISNHDKITYIELGKLINPTGENTEGAQKKYGENHGKFTNLLDFSFINCGRNKSFSITPLGKIYLTLNSIDKERILKFQFYKLFIIQSIINNHIVTKNELLDFLSSANLSLSTAKRRLPNVNSIISFLELNKTKGI